MPRTRLVWHLFAGWCGLVAAGLVVVSWLASVELARLSDDGEYRRMEDLARMASESMPEDPADTGALAAWQLSTQALSRSVGLQLELLAADGRLLLPITDDLRSDEAAASAASPDSSAARRSDDEALAAVRAGALRARGGRYDAEQGKRVLTLVVASGHANVMRITSDTAVLDRSLRASQLSLLAGFLTAAVMAVGAGYVVARRASAGVEELAESARRLARGSLDASIPTSDLAELSTIATAVEGLRDQLLERARTIGRQGSQQEAVLASMVEGVLAVDNRHRLLSVNTAAATLLGIEPGKVLLRPLQEVVRNPDLRRFVLRAIDCKETVEDDLLLRDGHRDRTILVRGTALRGPSGSHHGAVIVLNDVTHFRQLENIRRDFVANVSHELKTPTASIRGFVETLLDGAVDNRDDSRRFLSIIARQAERLEAIIEDLLALSRIERIEESSDLALETVALRDVVTAAIGSCQLRANERSIDVTVECDPNVLMAVNPPLLEQALINLIDNAIKYSDVGRTVRVRASSSETDAAGGDMLTVAVVDEGCGIDERFLPRIFERFYRVDRARSRKLGGTGLGLSIVKHIVQAHGGTVDVVSTPGVGSIFSIHLPMRQSAAVGMTA
jgi:two-component system phosphate regulon sensor histidine kinase PhoR